MHSTLVRTFTALLLAGGVTAQAVEPPSVALLRSGRPALLKAAFQAFLDEQQRWAYVETIFSVRANGSFSPESVIRTDPSQPYAQQSVPLIINGKQPTEKQLREWAQNSEKQAQRRLKVIEELAVAARDQDFRLRLLNREVRPLLEEAKTILEDDASVTYEIPMQELGGPGAAWVADHLLTARVNRVRREFEHVTIRQTKAVRIAAGKYYDGRTEVEFATPDPQYPAVPARVTFAGTNKPMFGEAQSSQRRIERKDFKRVTPYDERFSVKLQPLRLIQF